MPSHTHLSNAVKYFGWDWHLFFFFQKQCTCLSVLITCREIKKKKEKEKKLPLKHINVSPILNIRLANCCLSISQWYIYVLSNHQKYEDLISSEKRIYTKNRHNKAKLIHHNFHISLCWAVGQAHHIICLTQWVTSTNRILPRVCCCHGNAILSGMSCSQISSSGAAADTQQLSAFDHKQEFTPQSVCQKGSRLWWRSTSASTTSLFLFPLWAHCHYH